MSVGGYVPESVGEVSACDPVWPEGGWWWLCGEPILRGGGGQAGVWGHICSLCWRLRTAQRKARSHMQAGHTPPSVCMAAVYSQMEHATKCTREKKFLLTRDLSLTRHELGVWAGHTTACLMSPTVWASMFSFNSLNNQQQSILVPTLHKDL